MAAGELTDSLNLFSVPGAGPSLALSLHYGSLDSFNSSLGLGWSHSYDIFVSEHQNGEVVLHEGSGVSRLYTPANSGYTSQPGDYSTLKKNADGTFLLTRKDGTQYRFNGDGRIASIADRNGNALTFAYESGLLLAVTDPAGRAVTFSYDGSGKLASVTDPAGNAYLISVGDTLESVTFPDGATWSYSYDENAFLTAKTDPLGNLTTYAYDDEHRVVESTDPEGRVRRIDYPEVGETVRTTTFTEKNSGVWQYTYDTSAGDPLSKTDPEGNTTSYTYDANHNQLTKTDASGTTAYTYDAAGNMTSATDVAGQTTSYTYNEYGQVTSITDSAGDVTAYAYDEKGNLTRTTDPAGAVTAYAHDERGNVVAVTDALGRTTAMTYDSAGNMTSVTDPAGNTTRFQYDAAGRMVRQTDPQGNDTTFEYDARGNLIKVVDPLGNATVSSYDAVGNKVATADANGNTTRYEYNTQGQMVKMTDAEGFGTVFDYGGSGCPSCGGGGGEKLMAITDANGNTIRFEYDALGRKIRELDALGNSVSYTYDSRGNVLTRTDANGHVTTFVYDPLGRVKEQIYALGGEVKFAYDAGGRLTQVTDPIGVVTNYEYDATGRLIRTNSADAGTTTYTYNSDGTLETKTDANGVTASYNYDTAGRLSGVRFPDASENISYQYDSCPNGKGRLCSMADPSGTTAYSYDSMGRVVTEQKITLGVTYTTAYEYDKAGQVKAVTYPSGRKVAYTYDKRNRIKEITANLNRAVTLASNLTDDPVGNLRSLTFGNGLVQAWTYDPANRVKTITVPGALDYTYTYDPAGNITAIADGLNAVSKSYAYDPLDRLIQATGPWDNLAWTYNANGNRLTQQNGVKHTYTYQGNRLESVANGSIDYYRYDQAGNTVSDGAREFVYNQNNRLIEALENGRTLSEYIYNGKGQRIIKRSGPASTGSASGQTVVYHYDLSGRLIEETAGNGKMIADYVYLGSQPLAQIRKQGTGEETFYYHSDHLGTPKVMTDKLGKVVWNVEIDPFGNEIQTKGRQGGYIRNVENNLRFPGQYFDTESELHYNYFRDYDPRRGRYIESDPIGLKGGLNRFVYAQGDPVHKNDPSGLAYFAYRPLAGPASIFGVINDPMLDYLNLNVAHEQLFFEDKKFPFNLGFFDDGIVRTEMSDKAISAYEPIHSNGWNDCAMREAVERVGLKKYCLAGKPGPIDKYNCQDWAEMVRQEYRRLVRDKSIKSKCCVSPEEAAK